MKHFAFCLCAFLCCVAGAGFLEAAPATRLPQTAESKPDQSQTEWKAQDNSLPAQSGPGIVICEPVVAPADPVVSRFGVGCALWLQMTVGGQPQFGKTPLWDALARARSEMNCPNLQISSAKTLNLAPILGVTHAAVGALRGAEPHLSLTYQLLKTPSGAPVGAPITLTGTQEQIITGLPQMARTITRRLGVATPDIADAANLSPADMQLLGELRWPGSSARTESQQKALAALASRNPLAGLLSLSLGAYATNAGFNAAVKTLLGQAGGNAIAWGEIAVNGNLALLPYTAQLSALAAHYPGNYNLAVSETFRYRAMQDRKAELSAAERVVQDAPHNPDGWLTYASTISFMAEDLRQGRVYDALTPAESDTLSHLYPQWQSATQRAAELDPSYGKAWLRLAEAATFNGQLDLADHALKTALLRYADKSAVYGWALEMYQPKWGGDPAMLAHIAYLAATDNTMDASDTVYLAGQLDGNKDLQQKMLNDFISHRRGYLASHPGDGGGHWGLAALLRTAGDAKAALAEYQLAATLLPENAIIRYDTGSVLYQMGEVHYKSELYRQAIAQFQEAVRLDPDYVRAYIDMGYCQKNLHHFAEANSAFTTALRLNPASGSAYGGLGEVLLREKKPTEAIPDYQTAIRLGDFTDANYENLISALEETKQWDTLVATGEAYLRIYPNGNSDTYNQMANACLEKKEWDKSLALSQAALALNADDALAHENVAEAYIGAGRTAEAQSEWRKVLTLKDAREKAVAERYLKKYP